MPMNSTYKTFKDSIKEVTRYYLLLVEETKSQRLVGSTNEWVLDNFYMISEQEKVLKVDLRSREFRSIDNKRVQQLTGLLHGYLERCHFQIDKGLLFRYMSQTQTKQRDYLTYPEVCALLPLVKVLLLKELADLCREMDKSLANMEKLNEASHENLLVMNIFNSLKKMTKLPMAELIDSVSFAERMLKNEEAGCTTRCTTRRRMTIGQRLCG